MLHVSCKTVLISDKFKSEVFYMKIIFIRHGDPDYIKDSLTEKGWREAKLLAQRVCKWDFVTDFYCSPLGRAKDTASFSLEALGRKAQIMDWMQEFWHPIASPVDGHEQVCWDFMPDYWTADDRFMDKDHWLDTPIMQSNPEIASCCNEVYHGLDSILAKYGYQRRGHYYVCDENTDRDATIVLFCHLGVTLLMISHLLNISPVQLWQGFFLAPTSVTILGSEERQSGIVQFRAQTVGDTTHLHDGKEPISQAGYFTDPFPL